VANLAGDRLRWGSRRRAEAVSALSCLASSRNARVFSGTRTRPVRSPETEPATDQDLVQELTGFEPSILIEPDPPIAPGPRGAGSCNFAWRERRWTARTDSPPLLGPHADDSRRSAQISLRLSESEREGKRGDPDHRTQLLLRRRALVRFAATREAFFPVDASGSGKQTLDPDLPDSASRLF